MRKKAPHEFTMWNYSDPPPFFFIFFTHTPKMITIHSTAVFKSHPNIQKKTHAYPALFQTICLFVYCSDSWSGLACLPGSCSSAMLTGLISICPDKPPFGFYLRHSTSVGEGMGNVCHESASVAGMGTVLSHAIQRERPELFPEGSNTEQASLQDSFMLWFTCEIWLLWMTSQSGPKYLQM